MPIENEAILNAHLGQAEDERDEARAEVERLEAEKEAANREWVRTVQRAEEIAKRGEAAEAEVERLRNEIEEHRKAIVYGPKVGDPPTSMGVANRRLWDALDGKESP